MIIALLCMVVQGTMANNINLANISEDLELKNGDIVTGKLNKIVKISIADGATVTLSGVTITPEGNGNNKWSGIICEGDATIILADGTENKVRSFANDRSGICVPAGKTLTIDGTGSLDVAPNANESYDAGRNSAAAGIGGHEGYNSGNIIIKNGIIKARGVFWGPGIGGGYRATGGNILIKGGTVNARPGKNCGGIGCGYLGDNGTITITKDAVVTSYMEYPGIYSIGPSPSSYSKASTCGTVTIGCTLDGDGNPVSGSGHVGRVTASPFTYFCYDIVINDGSGNTSTQEVERGFDSGLTLNSITREGYTFLGWVAVNEGSKKFYPGGTKYSDLDVKPKTTITLTAQWIKGAGTAENPYEIASADDWLTMAHYMSTDGYTNYYNKHYKLTADISVTETVAKGATPVSMFGIGDERSFRGTFDGDGHTITLNITDNREEHYCGPFRIINGATIKNLHVTGTIVKATWKHVGGMVGKALGTNTITNCRSSVDIQVNTDGDCSSGGFIGDLRDGQTTLTGCTFDGKLRGPGGTESRSTKWGGFIGWVADGRKAILNTCVFAPAEIRINNTKDCRTFARRDDGDDNSRTLARMYESSDANINTTHCYYKLSIKETTQGALSAGGMSNDELADALGSGWNIFDDEVQPVMGLYTFDGNGTQASPYVIASAADWNGLSTNVATGETYNGKYFQLGANITVSRTVGPSESKSFQGYFDGAGNKLTFNCEGHKSNVAPFGYVNGATFENLHIAGTIHSSGYQIAGLICRAQGENYIRNCRNSITFDAAEGTGTVDGQSYGGYIMAITGGTTIFTGCIFDGSFASTTNYAPKNSAGFVSLMGSATVQINDCLFAPAAANVDVATFENFVRNPLGAQDLQLNNSYYINIENSDQGNKGIEIIPDYRITMEGYGIVTEYDVSGITGYLLTGVKYGDYLYAPSGKEVRINLDYDRPGYTATGYEVLGAGTITGEGNPYTLTITDSNVSSVTIYATTAKNTLQLANAADNSEAIIAAAATGKQYDVTLAGRTLFHDTKWNTLCLPFDVAEFNGTPLEGATVMELDTENFYTANGTIDKENGTFYTGFNATNGTLHLYFKTVTSIETGKPYIVKWNETNTSLGQNPVFGGVTLTDFSDSNGTTAAEKVANHLATCASESMDGAIQFIGTYAPLTYAAADRSILFLGTNNTLYYPDGKATTSINTHRAYFQLGDGLTAGEPADPNASSVRAFNLRFGDDEETQRVTTPLSPRRGVGGEASDAWFTLDGRRLSGKPTKGGLYINNGRKVVVK